MLHLSDTQNFKSSLDLNGTELWLISVLGRVGPTTSLQLAMALGKGKPQISRATAALVARGLILRKSSRAPIELTAEGKKIFARLRAVAVKRRTIIAQGLNAENLRVVMADIIIITKAAEQILAAEQNPNINAWPQEAADFEAAIDMLDDDALLPLFSTLSVLMKRIGALRCKRLAGISVFEWQVLARVAEAGEMEQRQLARTGRDNGQISRTVSALTERGLIERDKPAGRRNVQIKPTADGIETYGLVAADCFALDRQLTASLNDEHKNLVSDTIDAMLTNAQSLLTRNVAL